MLKVLDVAEVNPEDVNPSVYDPEPVMRKSVKLATPFTALTVNVPSRVPVPAAIAAVTGAVDVDTTELFASRTCTTG